MIQIAEREKVCANPHPTERTMLEQFYSDLITFDEFFKYLQMHHENQVAVAVIASASARKAFLLWCYLKNRWPVENPEDLSRWLKKNIQNGNGSLSTPVYIGEIDGQSVFVVPSTGETSENSAPMLQATAKRDSVVEKISEAPEAAGVEVTVLSLDTVQTTDPDNRSSY